MFKANVGATYIKEFLFIQVSVGGQKHYLRLTTLPHGVRLGDERETVPAVAGGRPAAGKPPSPNREPGTNCFLRYEYPRKFCFFLIKS
jgi:hypothetical protein